MVSSRGVFFIVGNLIFPAEPAGTQQKTFFRPLCTSADVPDGRRFPGRFQIPVRLCMPADVPDRVPSLSPYESENRKIAIRSLGSFPANKSMQEISS